MRGVPHHLIGYVDPNVNYTAADWAADAAAKIREGEVVGLAGQPRFFSDVKKQTVEMVLPEQNFDFLVVTMRIGGGLGHGQRRLKQQEKQENRNRSDQHVPRICAVK